MLKSDCVTKRCCINSLKVAGVITLVGGAVIFVFMLLALPKVHFLADGLLTLPWLVMAFLFGLLFFAFGVLHIAIAKLLDALNQSSGASG